MMTNTLTVLMAIVIAISNVAEPSYHVQDDVIDVFMVPHAHCDVGWLKTVEGYFDDQVSDILTTVTEALAADPSRRFIWSEIKWIQMWWPHQSDGMREKFRHIVRSGQFEFVGAGWSQNDEVTPHYGDIINNQYTGHEYLRQLGLQDECPIKGRCVRFGWQIDMFAGFSGATPTLWALAGFDGMFSRWEGTKLQRSQFQSEVAFEFIWDASANVASNRSRIWNHIINGNYGDLAGLKCGQNDTGHSWIKPDIPCTKENQDMSFTWPGSENVTSANVAEYAKFVAAFVKARHSVYQGPHLAVWGSDYLFTNASEMYKNMEKIHAEINANPSKYGIKIRFSTLAQYADHVNSLNLTFEVKTHVDFEYGWPHQWNMSLTNNFTTQYQTGATTSRSELKQTARKVASLHRAAEAVTTLAILTGRLAPPRSNETAPMMEAWDALGILQHHDAMTGTMSTKGSYPWGGSIDSKCFYGSPDCKPCDDVKCMCLEDYMNRLARASASCTTAYTLAVTRLLSDNDGSVVVASDINSLGASYSSTTNTTDNANTYTNNNINTNDANTNIYTNTNDNNVNTNNDNTTTNNSTNTNANTIEDVNVTVINPLAFDRLELVEIELPRAFTAALRSHSMQVEVEVDIEVEVEVIDDRGVVQVAQLSADLSAIFFIAKLSALGWRTYTLHHASFPVSHHNINNVDATPMNPRSPSTFQTVVRSFADADVSQVLANDVVTVTFDRNGGVQRWQSRGVDTNITLDYMMYVTDQGGPYCLVEQGVARVIPGKVNVTHYHGPLFSEVRTVRHWGDAEMSELVTVLRMVNGTSNDDVVVLTHHIPTIPINRELIVRMKTDLDTQGKIFNDDSGFELFEKIDDPTLPISGRFHAIVQTAALRETENRMNTSATSTSTSTSTSTAAARQLNLLSSHTKGVASLSNGYLEYMLVRRINGSDDQGPWPLNETAPLTMNMGLSIDVVATAERSRIKSAVMLENPPHVVFPKTQLTRLSGSPMMTLPPNIHLLHVFSRSDGIVVRFQNIDTTSTATMINVVKIFVGVEVLECKEMTLTLQQPRTASKRLHWNARPSITTSDMSEDAEFEADCTKILLSPLDIRTFVLEIKHH